MANTKNWWHGLKTNDLDQLTEWSLLLMINKIPYYVELVDDIKMIYALPCKVSKKWISKLSDLVRKEGKIAA